MNRQVSIEALRLVLRREHTYVLLAQPAHRSYIFGCGIPWHYHQSWRTRRG